MYTRDEATDFVESLIKLYTVDFDDRSRRTERYPAVIAEEPLNRDRRQMPTTPAVITSLDFSLTADDAHAAITAKETIVPSTSGQRTVWFALLDHVRDSRGVVHALVVRSVKGTDGSALPFVMQKGALLVGLPAPTATGTPINLTFSADGDILLRPSADNFWLLRSRWYPSFDLAGDAFTVHGIVKVKSPFMPFAGGHTVSRRVEGDYNVLEMTVDKPVSFLAIAAGKYAFEEEKRKGLTIRTASYGMKNARAIKQLTALAFDMIGYYEYFLGPFPFDELTIVEVNDYGWGQAPPGLVLITSEAFQPLIGLISQLFSEGINERIAHEIAHQYWGYAVKMPSFEEQWLEESFAEYSAAVLLKKFQGEGIYKRLVSHWKGDANFAANAAPIPLANRIVNPNNADWTRVRLLYSKGPYLLAAVNKDIGDEAFLTFLKSYQKNFRWKFGATKDVSGLLTFMTKKDYKPFFETYYWGTAIPEVK